MDISQYGNWTVGFSFLIIQIINKMKHGTVIVKIRNHGHVDYGNEYEAFIQDNGIAVVVNGDVVDRINSRHYKIIHDNRCPFKCGDEVEFSNNSFFEHAENGIFGSYLPNAQYPFIKINGYGYEYARRPQKEPEVKLFVDGKEVNLDMYFDVRITKEDGQITIDMEQ